MTKIKINKLTPVKTALLDLAVGADIADVDLADASLMVKSGALFDVVEVLDALGVCWGF